MELADKSQRKLPNIGFKRFKNNPLRISEFSEEVLGLLSPQR
jgi:hypothetical protein